MHGEFVFEDLWAGVGRLPNGDIEVHPAGASGGQVRALASAVASAGTRGQGCTAKTRLRKKLWEMAEGGEKDVK